MTSQTGYLSGRTLGRFRIVSLLGRGGMGEVYRAEDAELGRSVALKVLPESLIADPERLARFIQEARTASSLNHPHIVAIFDIGRVDQIQYVAMELVAGATLREALDTRRPDLKRVLDYLAQAADALAAAHAAGIVHRDLKPENLMIADGGYVKVLDFGLAKLRSEPAALAADNATVSGGTAPGMVMGTVGYMSPEQAQGRAVDQRSDIFSFGCILYEAVTGARAFSGASSVDTLHQIIHGQPEPIAGRLPSAPAELQRIVRKCLAKDPEDRYQSMKEVAIDLRDLRKQIESGAIAVPIAAAAPARRLAPFVAMSVVTLVAIAALAAAGFWWRARHTADAAAPPQITIAPVTASGIITDAALSPDGNYIVYTESAGGLQSLLYRQIKGTRPLELVPPAKVGYWGIQFSKDGTSVYYAVKGPGFPGGGWLFEIPVLGGTPRHLLSGIDSSVTFSPDGKQIAYLRAAYPSDGLSAVMVTAADGSGSRALATFKAPDLVAPGFFAAPSWSPDGKTIAVTVRNAVVRGAWLAIIDAVSGTVTNLPGRYTAATFTEWLPDGTGIVFVGSEGELGTGSAAGFGGQVFLQPYPSGPVRRITSDLLDYRLAHVSADGKSLLVVGWDSALGIWVAPAADPGAIRKVPSLRVDGNFGLAWSADAQRIFVGAFQNQGRQIWSMAVDGSDRRELPVDGATEQPAPSPDGTFVAFYAVHDGRSGLWRARPDGSDVRLLDEVSAPSFLTVSPDSRWLYYTSAASGRPSTWRVSTDGGHASLVATGLERGVVSPDGTLLAGLYIPVVGGGLSLGVLPVAGGPPVHVFPNFAPPTGSGTIRWSPDAASLYYSTVERANVFRQRLSGGAPEKITSYSDLTLVWFDLTRDGKQFVFARGTQSRDAFLITNFR